MVCDCFRATMKILRLRQILGWIQAMRRDQAEANRQFLEALTDPSVLQPTPVPVDQSSRRPAHVPRNPSALPIPDPQDPSALPTPYPSYGFDGSTAGGYGIESERSTGTWWGGTVSMSVSSGLKGLLTVAVLGGCVMMVGGTVLATLLLEQLVAGTVVCSSLGCLLANSVMLKTNWRQPSLMAVPSQPAPLPPIRLELLALQLHDSSELPCDWLLITPPAGNKPTKEQGPLQPDRLVMERVLGSSDPTSSGPALMSAEEKHAGTACDQTAEADVETCTWTSDWM
ncbi:hypothetical protein EYF80_027143 [Liparis tanakae]|uniref:Uncharacterized protein n=1 Tax=Liparis tanakae TaxID=230148 RepID=A0A4Z2HBI1_9TELE|nr:hypothetical protein EYF80_027143 [Liparis tanakae]